VLFQEFFHSHPTIHENAKEKKKNWYNMIKCANVLLGLSSPLLNIFIEQNQNLPTKAITRGVFKNEREKKLLGS